MRRRKKYMPECPAQDCTGGDSNRLYRVSADSVHVPDQHRSPEKNGFLLYRCSYCGFLWYQDPLGVDLNPIPVGFYNNFTKPNEFFAVGRDYPLKPRK